jgi:glutamine synthetase
MSVFSGSTLSKVFESIIKTKSLPKAKATKESIKIASTVPDIFPDNTDRNRTSPFAFTGNRFEFRAVGSSMNVAGATYVINSIVAASLREFRAEVDKLEAKGEKRDDAVMDVIRKFITVSQDIMFDGNGYSKEWQEEAAKRGIKAVTNVPDAFDVYKEKGTIDLFNKLGVLTPAELESRYEVYNETYVKKLQIEARVIGDICLNHVIPAAVTYQNVLMQSLRGAKEVFGEEYKKICKSDIETYKNISGYVNKLSVDVEKLVDARKKANAVADIAKRAKMYSRDVQDQMGKVRNSADHLEMIIDDEMWPLPKYRELLFF